jgi:hypothetical protein
MEKMTLKLTAAFVVFLLLGAAVTTVSAQTVDELAAKGAAIAKADPIVAAARTAERDILYWKGFDIATGIFGDPALGALGNTAMGTGSQQIRDSLSAAGQRGFNASVKLHLSRKYKRTSGGVTAIDNSGKRSAALDKVYGGLRNTGDGQVVKVGKGPGKAANIRVNLPFIDDVRVRPDTRDVIISFTSTQKTPPLIEIGKVAPASDQHGILAFPSGSGAFSRFVPGQKGKYSLNLGTLNEQLDIGTMYYYIINVFNDDKNNTNRPREQVTGKFTTLPQTVKVIFTDLRIFPEALDLTSLNKAKYVFIFDANVDYTTLGQRFIGVWPNLVVYDAGRIQLGTKYEPVEFPKGKISLQGEEIVIENSPDDLLIVVQGLQDADYPAKHPDSQQNYSTFAGAVAALGSQPPGNDPYSNSGAAYYNVARGNFDLSTFPGDSVSIPFTLSSKALSPSRGIFEGFLAFEISGRIEVTRH